MINNRIDSRKIRRWRTKDFLSLTACLLAALLAALWLAGQTGADFLAHCATDSYTLQALAWRRGEVSLGQDYPWLELAVYEGDWYVSFAPVPTIPMLLLSFFFGEQTPNALTNLVYFLLGVAAAYILLRRYMPSLQAGAAAFFAGAGGSLMDIVVSEGAFCGAVWYQAQLLAFCLSMMSFALMDQAKTSSKGKMAVSLIFIALCVGCRPLHAVYVPLLLWMLWDRLGRPKKGRAIVQMLPFVIIPLCIAFSYGAYNWIRFRNPFEFGQSYLPEFVRAQESMLSFERIWRNAGYCLRLPEVQAGAFVFPAVSGFAVYLTNPMFDFSLFRMGERTWKRNMETQDWILLFSVILHALLLLTHRTNGGWQYGTRYLCDCVPALVFAFVRGKKQIRRWEAALMGALLILNLLGIAAFHAM